MNANVRKNLGLEKQKIVRQLDAAVVFNGSGPTLGEEKIHFEMADKTRAIAHGRLGAIHQMVNKLQLSKRINEQLKLLTFHVPYYESDHVLNLAYNALCGGQTLDDIEHRRNDRVHLEALGTQSIPDPTTAGDFCRRFKPKDIETLQNVFNDVRVDVWKQHPTLTQQTARIDADGTLTPTRGQCKQGMDITFKREWGYHPLVVSLANTQEPLFIVNRSGNRPSHEGAIDAYNAAIRLVRRAGFTDVLLRGDTDFSLTGAFDAWTDNGVRFVFGFDASPTMKAWGDSAPEDMYRDLVRRADKNIEVKPRCRPENIKEKIVEQRGYENIKLKSEDVVDFEYQPGKCNKTYRVVAVRKNLEIWKGTTHLKDDKRYFFYITNDFVLTVDEVVQEAMQRCNQENLHAQLKAMRALHAPLNTLDANWAYMVMVALAWSLKAWFALRVPIAPRWREQHAEQRRLLLHMEFRTFLNAVIRIPCQVLRRGRQLIYRFLAWTPWLNVLFRQANVS